MLYACLLGPAGPAAATRSRKVSSSGLSHGSYCRRWRETARSSMDERSIPNASTTLASASSKHELSLASPRYGAVVGYVVGWAGRCSRTISRRPSRCVHEGLSVPTWSFVEMPQNDLHWRCWGFGQDPSAIRAHGKPIEHGFYRPRAAPERRERNGPPDEVKVSSVRKIPATTTARGARRTAW
jgi:hypothetical protein